MAARFDLESALAAWRRPLARTRALLDDDVDELEAHLRDHVEALTSAGMDEEAAFHHAVEQLGQVFDLEPEYRKVRWAKHRRRRSLWREVLWEGSMLANYFKVALRNLRRHAGYTFISVAGLAVGLACCLLILLFVEHELSYDRHHARADRVYRLVKGRSANTPERWGPALEAEFPDVERAVRIMEAFSRTLVRHEDIRFLEPRGLFADAAAFDVFDWPLLQGRPQTALAAPFTVVLSDALARKYFGDADPVGQTLTLAGIANAPEPRDFRVTGVLAAPAAPSHIAFDYLVSMATVEALDEAGIWGTPLSWTNRMAKTYLLLDGRVDPAHFEAQLPAFLRRHIADVHYDVTDARLQPLSRIYLHSNLQSEFGTGGNAAYVALFAALAVFILLLACINFMNLSTARAEQRAREVGMRKVLGAHRGQVVRQFLGESILLSLVALVVALGVLAVFRPVFEGLTGFELTRAALARPRVVGAVAGVLVAVGLLAGSYPALILSAFRPIAVLKSGGGPAPRGVLLRKGLVVFQFAVSIALLEGTFVIYGQLRYVRTSDLGFDQEQLVVLPVGNSAALSERWETVVDLVAGHPNVVAAAGSHSIPGQWLNGFRYRAEGASPDDGVSLGSLSVAHGLLGLYGVEVVAGRLFDPLLASDSTAFVLNETAARALGWASAADAVGRRLEWDFPDLGFEGPVIGVVRDFHFESLHHPIQPIAFHITRFGVNFVTARIRPTGIDETLAFFGDTWQAFEPEYPFDYYFFDDQFARQYTAEERLGRIFTYGALLAMWIACLGLFGLAAFTTERRRREIGVRKVFGATAPQIALMVSREFLTLVALAFVVACPPAYFGMERWLDRFAYRADIGPLLFAGVGALALVIALAAVGLQSLRAAWTDPVRSLRYE